MTPADAARLLELPANATPAQIEARFRELRAVLEDKIAKALTPGLQEKYRASLAEITTAFETLVLASDTASLPGLAAAPAPVVTQSKLPPLPSLPPLPASSPRPSLPPLPAATPSSSYATSAALPPLPGSMPLASPPPTPAAPPAPAKKSGGKGLLIGVAAAVIILAAGGWLVMKIRADHAEKARVEAEARQQAELARQQAEAQEKARLAAAEKAERERKDKLLAELRTRIGATHAAFDTVMRGRLAAESDLAALKTRADALVAEAKPDSAPALRSLEARTKAQERYVTWLNDNLPAHPAKAARAKAEAALNTRDPEAAAKAADAYEAALKQLKADLVAAKAGTAISGPLTLASNLDGTTWQATDAFGIERSGSAPATVDDVAFGVCTLVFRRAGWPDQQLAVENRPGQEPVSVKFPIGALRVETQPAGAQVFRGDEALGVTPLDLPQLPPGEIALQLKLKKFKNQKLTGRVEPGKTTTLRASLAPGFGNDPIALLEAVNENLALVPDPQARANVLFGLIMMTPIIDGVPRPSVLALLDAHLAACRAISDPKERFDAVQLVTYSNVFSQVDFTRSHALMAEAIPALEALTNQNQRELASYGVAAFSIHPDLFARAVNTVSTWFNAKDSWINRAMIAGYYKQLGNEAATQRLTASARDPSSEFQNNMVKEYVDKGVAARQFDPVKLALAKGDLAAAQRELARVSAKLEYSDLFKLVSAFMQLGDFESPLRLAKLAEAQYIDASDTMTALVMSAAAVENFPLAEKWAASLPDTTEKPKRSQAYRTLARNYLSLDMKREAALAGSKVVTFDTTEYSTDRFDTVLMLAELGQMDRARQLAATIKVAYTKEGVYRLTSAAPMFLALGDNASVDRALRFIKTESPDMLDSTYYGIVAALGRLGRYAEAEKYNALILKPAPWQKASVDGLRIAALVRNTPEAQLDDLIEKSAPGLERLQILSGILARNYQQKLLARYSPPQTP